MSAREFPRSSRRERGDFSANDIEITIQLIYPFDLPLLTVSFCIEDHTIRYEMATTSTSHLVTSTLSHSPRPHSVSIFASHQQFLRGRPSSSTITPKHVQTQTQTRSLKSSSQDRPTRWITRSATPSSSFSSHTDLVKQRQISPTTSSIPIPFFHQLSSIRSIHSSSLRHQHALTPNSEQTPVVRPGVVGMSHEGGLKTAEGLEIPMIIGEQSQKQMKVEKKPLRTEGLKGKKAAISLVST